LLDKNKEYFLGINKSRSKIYLFKNNGKLHKILDSKGEGPEEYKSIKKLGFLGEDKIIIINDFSVITYGVDGDFINKCSISYSDFAVNSYLSLIGDENHGRIVFPVHHPTNFSDNLEFFKNPENFTFVRFNANTCTYTPFGAYEEGSIYRKEFFPNMIVSWIDYDKHERALYSLLPYDRVIQIYDLDSLELKKQIKLYPEFFSLPKGTKPGNNSLEIQIQLFQSNPSYTKLLLSQNGEILTRYLMPRQKEDIAPTIAQFNSSNSIEKNKAYFEFYSKNGVKLCNDIEDKTEGAILLKFQKTDSILFYSNSLNAGDDLESMEGLFLLIASLQESKKRNN